MDPTSCQRCGAPTKPLFTSRYCAAECDLRPPRTAADRFPLLGSIVIHRGSRMTGDAETWWVHHAPAMVPREDVLAAAPGFIWMFSCDPRRALEELERYASHFGSADLLRTHSPENNALGPVFITSGLLLSRTR